ncbi:MAG: DUF1801 domain-containing protein [Niastella sp.]|nr:DUF1801 domain-containing protein [Niastella sp.]
MSSKKVDEFLAKLDNPLKKEMTVLRDTIMKMHPDMTEDVKWGGPSFYYKGDIATFSLRVKDTVTLIFHQAEGLTPGDVLEPAPKGKAYARFKGMAEIKAKSKGLQNIIKQWIAMKDKS